MAITDILKKGTDTNLSFTEVMSRALQGKTTFGSALNQIRAEEQKAQATEQGMDLAQRQMDLAEQEFDFNQKKFRTEYANADAEAFQDRFKFWSEGMSKPDQVKLYDYAKNHEQPVGVGNADRVLSQGIGELGLKRAADPQKQSMTPIRVRNDQSSTGYSWMEPANPGKFIGEAPAPSGAGGKYRTVLLPSGKSATGREIGGQLSYLTGYSDAGKAIYVPVPPGTTVISQQSEIGPTGDVVLRRKFHENKVAMKNMVDMATDVRGFLRDPNFIAGIGGATVRALNSLRAQGESLARAYEALGSGHEDAAGNDISWSDITDPDRYKSDTLRKLAGTNVRAASALIGIAYMLARSQDPSGRLSDQDVERALDQLGANSNDPLIIEQTVNDAVWRAWYNFENQAEEMGAAPKAEDFGLADFGSPENKRGVESMSTDELKALFR